MAQTINRLSDKKIGTLGPSKHADGAGLYLRLVESTHDSREPPQLLFRRRNASMN